MAKKRRWSNLKGVLPADVETTVSPWMQKVLVEVDQRADKSMEALADEYAGLDAQEDEAAKLAAERAIKYKALEMCILKRLEVVKATAGTDMWRGGGMTFSPRFSPRPVVEDKAALMKWIEDTKQQELLTLAAPTLKAIVCEALDTDIAALLTVEQRATLSPGDPGSSQPPPGVKVFLQETITRTAKKFNLTEAVLEERGGEPEATEDGPF